MKTDQETKRKLESGTSANPFPLEFVELEIDQQRKLQLSNVQIAEHLGDVRVVERGNDFGIHNHRFVDNQIGL